MLVKTGDCGGDEKGDEGDEGDKAEAPQDSDNLRLSRYLSFFSSALQQTFVRYLSHLPKVSTLK